MYSSKGAKIHLVFKCIFVLSGTVWDIEFKCSDFFFYLFLFLFNLSEIFELFWVCRMHATVPWLFKMYSVISKERVVCIVEVNDKSSDNSEPCLFSIILSALYVTHLNYVLFMMWLQVNTNLYLLNLFQTISSNSSHILVFPSLIESHFIRYIPG